MGQTLHALLRQAAWPILCAEVLLKFAVGCCIRKVDNQLAAATQ